MDEAVQLEAQLAQVRGRLERWTETERWEPLALEDGPLALLGGTLDRGFARELELREQNQSVARLMREELGSARDDARESVEQAERGFVEATALLTTVRELQRLGGELQGTLASPVTEPAPASDAGEFRAAVARAIEELVAASIDSVDQLASGLSHVQEIAEQVHAIANRSTLIALNAAVASGRGEPGAEELAAELKNLTREVRVATERTDQLSRDVEREVRSASARMAEVRGRVALELESSPARAPAAPGAPRASEDVQRLMERVREMVQDATRKGERLSAAGERSSRAAQRLVRRLEEQLREFEGLVVRLGPAMALPEEPTAGDEGVTGGAGLRLLESERVTDEDSGAGEAEEKQ